jgi:hypothetical protein
MQICRDELECLNVGIFLLFTIGPLMAILFLVQPILVKIKTKIGSKITRTCLDGEHSFSLKDLIVVDECSLDHRVQWKCMSCSIVFKAHCGLDITPKHGYIKNYSNKKSIN